jgi:S1-C subfamily serine protease
VRSNPEQPVEGDQGRPKAIGGDRGHADPIPLFVHLTGRRRGATDRPRGDYLRIGTFPGAEIELAATGEVPPEEYAVLRRQGDLYEIDVAKGKEVFVNGDPVDRRVLATGDVLEVGRGGPVLRFRLYPSGSGAWKTVTHALADGTDSARRVSSTRLGRVSRIMRAVPRELVTQTSWTVRALFLVPTALLLVAAGLFGWRSIVLERRLAEERGRVAGLADLLERQAENPRTNSELVRMLEEMQSNLTQTARRLHALEGQSAAARLVIAAATRSTAFVQGSWGFVDPQTGQPLRVVVGMDGSPIVGPDGGPLVTTDERAPVLEALFTGTAFAVGDEGHLITNRHIAEPWRFELAAQQVASQGWVPVMRRLLAYLPGVAEPFAVQLVAASDSADLAILRIERPGRAFASLPIADDLPQAGEEVIVLGYPLGIRALVARADQRFVSELRADSTADFWKVAERLGRAGQIAPLASRGIVSQVSPAAVVYDAETTVGGSGGPVLSLKGEVLAVNSAILPEFGGSNLGVPGRVAAALLRGARRPTR